MSGKATRSSSPAGASRQYRAVAAALRANRARAARGSGRRQRPGPARRIREAARPEDTQIVSVTQVSNALGTVTPVTEMIELAHQPRRLRRWSTARSRCRTCRWTCRRSTAISSSSPATRCSARRASAWSTASDAFSTHMPPWQGGGNMIADVTFENTLYQPPPERFEAGTGNIADAVGLGAAIDYVERVGHGEHRRLRARSAGLRDRERAAHVPGLQLIGTAREKASVLSFVLDGYRHRGRRRGAQRGRHRRALRPSLRAADPAALRRGEHGRPRSRFYNTCEDIDALVDVLFKLQGRN